MEAVQDGKTAAAGERALDLFGQPITPEAAEKETTNDRRANKPIQKLHRQIEQKVREIKAWSVVGLTCDAEADKLDALERVRDLSRDLVAHIDKVSPTVTP